MPLLRSFFIAKRLAKRGVFVPFSAGVWYGFSIAGARCLGSLYFMSGHSKWSKIKRQKGVSDAKKAKVFAKLAREIGIAVRLGGPEADLNPRLRMILLKCRSANMPADNIDRAIKRAAGDDDDAHFEELTYEIFVSGGVAVLAHAHTDNRNRSAADIRHIVTKAGAKISKVSSSNWASSSSPADNIDRAIKRAAGMLALRHLSRIIRRRGFMSASGPPTRTAMPISRASLANTFAFLASVAPFFRLIVDHLL